MLMQDIRPAATPARTWTVAGAASYRFGGPAVFADPVAARSGPVFAAPFLGACWVNKALAGDQTSDIPEFNSELAARWRW